MDKTREMELIDVVMDAIVSVRDTNYVVDVWSEGQTLTTTSSTSYSPSESGCVRIKNWTQCWDCEDSENGKYCQKCYVVRDWAVNVVEMLKGAG